MKDLVLLLLNSDSKVQCIKSKIKKAANLKHLKSEKLEEMIGTGQDHIAKKLL
jgi:hypothetical protein